MQASNVGLSIHADERRSTRSTFVFHHTIHPLSQRNTQRMRFRDSCFHFNRRQEQLSRFHSMSKTQIHRFLIQFEFSNQLTLSNCGIRFIHPTNCERRIGQNQRTNRISSCHRHRKRPFEAFRSVWSTSSYFSYKKTSKENSKQDCVMRFSIDRRLKYIRTY